MDLNKIRYFRCVAETKNLRRAAELMHISPGALSKSMKQLEKELGHRLFVPEGRGLAVTDQGQRLYKLGDRVLQEYQAMIGELNSKREESGELRVGSFEVFTTYFWAHFLDRHLPNAKVLLRELTPGKLECALLERDIDVGITYAPFPNEKLEFLKVSVLEMGAFGKAAKFKDVPLNRIPFSIPVTATYGSAEKIQDLDGWPAEKAPRLVKYKFAMMETGIAAARRGLSVIFCPRFIAKLHNETVRSEYALEEIELPKAVGKVQLPVYIVKRKTDAENRSIRLLASALRQYCH